MGAGFAPAAGAMDPANASAAYLYLNFLSIRSGFSNVRVRYNISPSQDLLSNTRTNLRVNFVDTGANASSCASGSTTCSRNPHPEDDVRLQHLRRVFELADPDAPKYLQLQLRDQDLLPRRGALQEHQQ